MLMFTENSDNNDHGHETVNGNYSGMENNLFIPSFI